MKKQFSEPTELSMDELNLVNGGFDVEVMSGPAMYEGTHGSSPAQDLSDIANTGVSDQIVFHDVGLPMKCTNPDCKKCGIPELAMYRRCSNCGRFMTLAF